MKSQAILALVLIVLGVVALIYQGFSYTTREKAIDLGPIEVTAEEKHTVPLPPIVGAVAIIAGAALLARSK